MYYIEFSVCAELRREQEAAEVILIFQMCRAKGALCT